MPSSSAGNGDAVRDRELVVHSLDGSFHVLTVVSEIDIYSAPAFEAEIAKASGADYIIVDLSPSRYVDSSGYHVLWRALKAYRKRLRIVVRPGSTVERVLQVLQLHTQTPLFPSLDDARASL